MSESATNKFYKALKILCEDLNVVGWDQPHKFYLIKGDPEDPTFSLLCEVPLEEHPAEFLQFVFTTAKEVGLKPIPDDAIGLLLVNEGWRHLNFEEVEEIDPEGVAEFKRQGAERGFNDEELRVAFAKAQYGIKPSDFPPDMRREIRCLTAVVKGQPVIGAMYERLNGTFTTSEDEGVEKLGGRIPDAMSRLVAGEEPEPAQAPRWKTPAISELLKRGSK